jgi:putative Mn2+ efflux pump MntP
VGTPCCKPSAARLAESISQQPKGANRLRTGHLLVTGIALSIDNLAIGFALGAYHVDLAAAALIVGAVSVTLSLIGLELGDRLGTRPAGGGELLGRPGPHRRRDSHCQRHPLVPPLALPHD